MAGFVAKVEFRFEAESLQSGGERLRELLDVARAVGFEMEHGHIEQVRAADSDQRLASTGYGPNITH